MIQANLKQNATLTSVSVICRGQFPCGNREMNLAYSKRFDYNMILRDFTFTIQLLY